MPKKLRLDADRDAVQKRMENGELMDSFAVWKSSSTGTYKWAYATLSRWHQAGLIHVTKWERRPEGGKPRPFYRWGNGADAPPLAPMPNSVKHKRYMKKLYDDPARLAAHRDRRALRERKTPKLDPIHAAMLGYKRHGKAWIKPHAKPHTNNEAA